MENVRAKVGGVVIVLATAAMMIGAGRSVVARVDPMDDAKVTRFEFERLGNRVDTLYFLFTSMGLGFGGLELMRKNRGGDGVGAVGAVAKAGGAE